MKYIIIQIISHITPSLDKKKKISIPFNNFKYFRVFSQLSFKTIISNIYKGGIIIIDSPIFKIKYMKNKSTKKSKIYIKKIRAVILLKQKYKIKIVKYKIAKIFKDFIFILSEAIKNISKTFNKITNIKSFTLKVYFKI